MFTLFPVGLKKSNRGHSCAFGFALVLVTTSLSGRFAQRPLTYEEYKKNLIARLLSGDSDRQIGAALIIRVDHVYGPDVEKALIKSLPDAHPTAQAQIAITMGAIIGKPSPQALQALWTVTQSKHAQAAIEAARAYWILTEDIKCLPPLIPFVRGGADKSRRRAIEVIGTIGPAAKQAVPDLINPLQSKKFQLEAVTALGRIGFASKRALPPHFSNSQTGEEQCSCLSVCHCSMANRPG